jgi:hypothetical protein
VSAKKVTNTNNIGEAPLSIVNFPITANEARMTIIHTTAPIIRDARKVIITHAPSYFGGQSISSTVRLSMFSIVSDIVYKKQKGAYRDKYIRKVQDCKIFHWYEVYDMSDEDPFIGMRKCSGEYECIASIEKAGFFWILFTDIVVSESDEYGYRDTLEWDSSDREWEGDTMIIRELYTEKISPNGNISICTVWKYRKTVKYPGLIKSPENILRK